MKKNFFSMNDNEIIEFIKEEVSIYKQELGKTNSLAQGYQKVKLSELQEYSNILQASSNFSPTGKAAELKTEIDKYLNQYSVEPMIRKIEPLDMTDYHKRNNQFMAGYIR